MTTCILYGRYQAFCFFSLSAFTWLGDMIDYGTYTAIDSQGYGKLHDCNITIFTEDIYISN
jgi:hypothetical protein